MAASQVALLESTGRPVIGVFQTLSEGKASQLVPGRTTAGPPEPDPGPGGDQLGDAARAEPPVPATTVASAIAAAPMTTLRDSEQTLLIVFLLR
jgi:hypothetical protein